MEGKGESPRNSFTSAMKLTQLGVSHVPHRYVLPLSQRPNPTLEVNTTLPIIDLSSLNHPSERSLVVDNIQGASKQYGLFQVINHGIPPNVMQDALHAATEFFNLSIEEKMHYLSNNVHDPVRYGTSLNHTRDKIHFWRDFLKHYSHPISSWIHLWPSNPPSYKDKMGNYAKAVHLLQKQLMEAVSESLGLKPGQLQEEAEEGTQLMAINCYPACPEPDLALGMPPHSDYGTLTILLQSCPGLQIMDRNKNWLSVPAVEGALIVQLGDQLEVMSNGQYKSVVHRVTVSEENKRLSIASIHSLALHKKVGPSQVLVNRQNPSAYNEFSFKDFLDYISRNDITDRRFLETLKKTP